MPDRKGGLWKSVSKVLASLSFEVIGTGIWIVFILDFALEFFLAPRKAPYLKRNWLTALSLLVPAVRIFRVFRMVRLFRLARVGRGLRMFRLLSSLNRGMRALGASLRRRGFGYVIVLTVLVAFTGAAGMHAFEKGVPGGLYNYGEALWWTAMIMTTMGSQYWPQTAPVADIRAKPFHRCAKGKRVARPYDSNFSQVLASIPSRFSPKISRPDHGSLPTSGRCLWQAGCFRDRLYFIFPFASVLIRYASASPAPKDSVSPATM